MDENLFGLGIEITLQDSITRPAMGILDIFRSLREGAEVTVTDIDSTLQRLQNMQIAGNFLNYTGSMMENWGSRILGIFQQVGQGVLNIGDDFEKTRMTLEALYKSKSAAEDKMKWLMQYAAETPFEITELKGTMIGLKAIGIEADKMVTSVKGTRQELMSFVGDLGALRPDVGMARLAYAIRNALGGNVRSLAMALDVDVNKILGRKFGESGDPAQDIADLVEGLGAAGLMQKLSGTWSQMLSNLRDQLTRFYLGIADSGAFDSAKKSLKYFSDIIAGIDDEKMKTIGKNLADVFKLIWTPIDYIIKGISFLIKKFAELAEANSWIVKIIVPIVAFGGGLLVATGLLFKFSGGILLTVSSLLTMIFTMTGATISLEALTTKIKLGLTSMFGTMLGFIALAGAIYLAWKFNFMGLRDVVTKTTTAIKDAFKWVKLDLDNFLATRKNLLSYGDAYSSLTVKIMDFLLVAQGIAEVFSDNTLSEQTFLKLNATGLLPIIESFLRLKFGVQDLWTGIKKGFTGVMEFSQTVGRLVGKVYDFVAMIFDTVSGIYDSITGKQSALTEDTAKFADAVKRIPSDKLIKIGEILGYVVGIAIALRMFTGLLRLISKLGVAFGAIKAILLPILTVLWNIGTWLVGIIATALGVSAAVVVAIAAVIAIVGYLIYKNWDKIVAFYNKAKEYFSDVWSHITAKAVEAKDKILGAWGEVKDFFSNIGNTIKNLFGGGGTITVKPATVETKGGKPVTPQKKQPVQRLSTGGETKGEGLAYLHKREVVVNSPLTQRLGDFLGRNANRPSEVKNSITFETGSIQISLQNTSEKEIDEKLINTIASKLQRKLELQRMSQYKPVNA